MVGHGTPSHRTGRQRFDRLRLKLPRRARRSRDKSVGAMPLLMRRMMILVVTGLAVLASLGGRWHSQRGGNDTRIAFAVARTICPTEARFMKRTSVAAGAHAIDRAALRLLVDLVSSRSRCTALPRRSGSAG
jgi:hypothetical protein